MESSTIEGGQSIDWLEDIFGCKSLIDSDCDTGIADYGEPLGIDQVFAFLGPRIMDCNKMGLQEGGFLFPVPVGQTGFRPRTADA